MERRKFIKVALVSTPLLAGGASAGTRLYGTPASVEPVASIVGDDSGKLVLSLSRSGLPHHFWEKIRSISTIVLGVLDSPEEGEAFACSPRAYLARHGLDHSDSILEDETLRLVATISQPAVRDAIANKDYASFMQHLKSTGVLNFDSSRLQKEIETAISGKVDELRSMLQKSLMQLPGQERESFLTMLSSPGAGATDDDLAMTYQLVKGELGTSPALAIFAVTIAVVVVTAAAAAVLWVYTAGWVWGGPGTSSSPAMQPATSLGKLAEADPNLTKSYERAMKIAALTGESAILEESARSVMLAESVPVIQALRNTQILEISSESADRIAETIALYAYKAVGV
ncbi:hypothetical protein NX80_003125 [Xanthomonas vasicola pv. arecae]|uniref:hypothetical protein n=1 Tax=Xanthomonas vasicola TaxID=56459 RepID=UPI00052D10E2|nr:hypothetical protein [Xanthomonas vasicola]AZR25646.1 hypothetical protein NX80_003125 [Xanthomonas vasicola pv. arecae]